MHRKLRLGMVGGGKGSFIGAVHRIAARMDNEYELVCGAFSATPGVSLSSGLELGIDPSRIYNSWNQMFETEHSLPPGIRMEVVAIVTPNHLHYEPAKLALEMGIHVIMDKPMTLNLEEALALQEIVRNSGRLFCLTHTYTGYPMIKEARQRISSGDFGTIRKVYVEYPQGWLSTPLENTGNKQAEWRADPTRNGIGGAMGDIGTHAFNMAEYVSGSKVKSVCADINKVVTGRLLDDDGTILLKFENDATGVLIATQVAAGEENNIKVRIYGEKGGVEWQQKNANTLLIKWPDKPAEVLRSGVNSQYLSTYATSNCRTPSGHPEGYLEAFANHYRNFARCIKAKQEGYIPEQEWLDYPGVEEGVRGMAFIESVISSGNSSQKWLPLTTSK